MDLLQRDDAEDLLTDAMKRIVASKRFGSYPMSMAHGLGQPAPTIKRGMRPCGNGRYVHPEQDRLCSVRELARCRAFKMISSFNGAAVSTLPAHRRCGPPADLLPTGQALPIGFSREGNREVRKSFFWNEPEQP